VTTESVDPRSGFINQQSWLVWLRAAVLVLLSAASLYYWFWIIAVAQAFGPHPRIWFRIGGEAAVLIAAICVAAWHARGTGPNLGTRAAAVIGLAWSLAAFAVWYCFCSPFSRDPLVAVFFAATSWWLAWMWMMLLLPIGRFRRGAVLIGLISIVALFGLSVRSDGIDGQALPKLVWRIAGQIGAPTALAGEAASNSIVSEGDYSRFRGPDALGMSRGAHLARDWSGQPPRQIWRRPVGAGWSAIAVVGSQAFTQEQRDDDECVVCFERASGRELWRHRDRAHYMASGTGDGPRATPTVEGASVYTLGATGILNALNRADGSRLWSVDIMKDNQATAPGHGATGSPLVVGDLVVVAPGGAKASLAAYDKSNGSRRWRAGSDPASYASPMLVEIDGQPQVLVVSTQNIVAHEPRSGEVLWTFPWRNDQQTNCSQPIPLAPNRVFLSADYGTGCALVELAHERGAWKPKQRWASRAMQTKFSSPVLREGHVYGLDDGILECVSLADGRRKWKSGRYGHGQLLLADDLLVVMAEDGRVALVAAEPEKFRELGQFQALQGKTWNYPALAGNQLFIRNDREAACYELPRVEN
jgi:outer membrane protein assembly factor BamB